MSRENVIAFYCRLNNDEELRYEFERLLADNIALIAIVKLAEKNGFAFTSRELAEHLIQSSSDKNDFEPVVPHFLKKTVQSENIESSK